MVAGIIAEYNPFHNGHLYQINKIRDLCGQDTKIICCISGGLTQRGEVPILDKWQRAVLATENGANVVLELPALFVNNSAQYFAFGGVSLLHRLNVVDVLAFSTAYPDLNILRDMADFPLSGCKNELRTLLKEGYSYASAVSQVISQQLHIEPSILTEPNTILAVEYIKALNSLSSAIRPLAIKRNGTEHRGLEINRTFASGGAVRNLLKKNDMSSISQVVPQNTFNMLSNKHSAAFDLERLFPALQLKLITGSDRDLRKIYSVSEGLEHKLLEYANTSCLKEFAERLTNKRYQRSRINRLIVNLLLNVEDEIARKANAAGAAYGRVLAFDDTGRQLLKDIKTKADVPLITKLTAQINRRDFLGSNFNNPIKNMMRYDILATNLYELCQNNPILWRDFTTSPIYVQK